MKILKMKIKGLPLMNSSVDVDINFTATQRVDEEDKEYLFNAFSNIYLQHSLAFVGINASGKTTLLSAIFLGFRIVNHRSINIKKRHSVLSGCKQVDYDIYFTHRDEVCRLWTRIIPGSREYEEGEQFVISEEKLWVKKRKSVKSKSGLFQFDEEHPQRQRKQGGESEEYLSDDISMFWTS